MNSANDHIPTTEIEQDIADTEREIALMQREVAALEMVPRESRDFRMSRFRADARRDGIKEREEFIAKLRTLLVERMKANSVPDGNEEHLAPQLSQNSVP